MWLATQLTLGILRSWYLGTVSGSSHTIQLKAAGSVSLDEGTWMQLLLNYIIQQRNRPSGQRESKQSVIFKILLIFTSTIIISN